PTANFDNPPGLYGSEDVFTSLNVLPENAELKPLDTTGTNAGRNRENAPFMKRTIRLSDRSSRKAARKSAGFADQLSPPIRP
ncbi:hypothetical protein ACC718_39020, partial [Rhizobium ruizarguesonis]